MDQYLRMMMDDQRKRSTIRGQLASEEDEAHGKQTVEVQA